MPTSRRNRSLRTTSSYSAILAAIRFSRASSRTEEGLKVAGQDYDAAANLPVLIYPNPLNPDRYVVVNSGHTFGEAEFLGTNALLFPRLGDWAVLSTADESTVAAGLFDEEWR